MRCLLCIVIVILMGVASAAETRKICVDVKDKAGKVEMDKTGKPKQNCRQVKQHAKLDGTVVPSKK